MSSIASPERSHGVTPPGLSDFEGGATTVIALSTDPRFSYCLYVPTTGNLDERSILAVIHGSYRKFNIHRDQFRDFGEDQNCIILAPLFAGNVLGDGNLDGFKYLVEGDIRYDRVLEAIVEEVRARYAVGNTRFGLVGFSGGAHFAHRFFILRAGAALGRLHRGARFGDAAGPRTRLVARGPRHRRAFRCLVRP